MNQQRGGIAMNILLVLMLAVIGILIYMLANGGRFVIGRTSGVDSPVGADTQISSGTTPRAVTGEFSDGLGKPDSISQNSLDEFGAGIASVEIFNRDINGDGRADRITRTRVENGTPHFYYEYKIELNENGRYIDITPDGFRTTEGADCALQKLHFSFKPDFIVTKISRKWRDTWTTPTMATKTTYALHGNHLNITDSVQLKEICNVADLFL